MVGDLIKLGLVAGLVAGILAGIVGQIAGEPSIDAAIEIEEAAEEDAAVVGAHEEDDDEDEISRAAQKVGLVVGTALFGLALGAAFGVALAWSAGRLRGDAWQRSLRIGAVVALAVAIVPAVKYPANPPAVGDPDTIGSRTALYLLLVALNLLLAAAAYAVTRRLRAQGTPEHLVQTITWPGVIAVAIVLLVALPSIEGAGDFPADILWSFRLGSLATQLTLIGGTAVGLGLLAMRAQGTTGRPAVADGAAPAPSR